MVEIEQSAGGSDAVAGIIRWAFDRVRRHLTRYGVRLTQAGGGLSDLYVSIDEVQRVLGDLPTEAAPLDPPLALPAAGPIARLQARFDLTPRELAVLLGAAAPLLSIDVARLYSFAWADFSVKQPSPGFLCELVSDDAAAATIAQAAFRADAPLVRARLIQLNATDAWGPDAPRLHQGVTVPESVLAFLRGEPPIVTEVDAGLGAEAPDLPAAVRERLARAVAESLSAGPRCPRLLLVGEAGTGREAGLRAALAVVGQPLTTVDADQWPTDPDRFDAALAEVTREVQLYGQVLLLRADRLLDDLDETLLARLAARLREPIGLVALTARHAAGALHAALGGLHEIRFPLPPAARQLDLWRQALGDDEDGDVAARLAERFNVSPGVIRAAVDEARQEARLAGASDAEPTLTADAVARAVRRRVNHALNVLAEPMSTTLTWHDVVLPEEVIDTLREILAQARHRARVYDDWGFRQKMAYGRGLSCLFAGPPGTGKTMMAGIMARELGQELYRVDLSRVVSKWVGETEKNLGRVFDEARRAQVILFFDEADSLFSARTEVKGANDRFANMEVNYLLQRMEDHDGMSILTTNFERSLDEAFKRRLKFRVHFPMPDAGERAKLWQRMIPQKTPIEDGIGFDMLGKRYKMSGGNIKNAVLRAAFYAADRDQALSEALLVRAAEAEAREMGRL
ncbi:MAG: AAA family ATPase [Myxococcales bacterium]|nr:AAA family ATPase [Myxococcales bacterium]